MVFTLSLLSFFVVLRRIAFIGVGISHSALGGVALGLVLGLNETIVTTLFCTGVALTIGFISRKGHLREDTAIGITFAGTMAFGIALIALKGGYLSSLFSFLFGSIVSITANDIAAMAIYCGVTTAIIALLFKGFLQASFDEEVAKAAGVPVEALHYLLLVLISISIVASIKLVGIILVSALLVLPAATAYQIVQTYRKLIALSVVFGILSLLLGLFLSYRFDLPPGATIVLCGCIVFFVCFLLSPRRRKRGGA